MRRPATQAARPAWLKGRAAWADREWLCLACSALSRFCFARSVRAADRVVEEIVDLLGVFGMEHVVGVGGAASMVELFPEVGVSRDRAGEGGEHLEVPLAVGLRASVHSDDPAYFGGYVNDNLRGVVSALPVSAADAYRLLRNSLESSFMEPSEIAHHVERLNEVFAAG